MDSADTVTLNKSDGSRLKDLEIFLSDNGSWLLRLPGGPVVFLSTLVSEGWVPTFTAPLPTDPGPYTDREGDVWVIKELGDELQVATFGGAEGRLYPVSNEAANPKDYAPFRKLVPEE